MTFKLYKHYPKPTTKVVNAHKHCSYMVWLLDIDTYVDWIVCLLSLLYTLPLHEYEINVGKLKGDAKIIVVD